MARARGLICSWSWLVLTVSLASGQPRKEPDNSHVVYESILTKHTILRGAVLNKTQDILVTFGQGPSILIWHSFDSPKKRKTLQINTPGTVIATGTFANLKDDVTVLVSGDNRGDIRSWSLINGKELFMFRGHDNGEVYGLTFSEREKTLVSCGIQRGEAAVRFWDLDAPRPIRDLNVGLIDAMAFSRKGDLLALANQGGTLYLMRYPSCKPVWNRCEDKRSAAHSIDFAPNGKTIISPEFGRPNCWVRFWDVETGLPVGKIAVHPIEEDKPFRSEKKTQGVRLARFSPSGLLIASGGYDHKVCLWEVATKQNVTTITGHTDAISSIVFHEGDNKFVTTSFGGEVFLCDLAKIKKVHFPPENREIPAKLDGWWHDLQSGETLKGVVAVEFLFKHRDSAVPFLKKKTVVEKPPSADALGRFVTDLASDNFKTREQAALEIEKHLYVAEPLLRKKLGTDVPVDLSRRIEALLEKIPKLDGMKPAELRPLRVISVLERIDSAESREVLAWMSKYADSERVKAEAKNALQPNQP